MKHLMRYGFIAACLVIGVLMIAGCGGDDDKGTGSSGLTAQDQFTQLTQFIEFDPDAVESDNFNVSDLMLSQTFTQFWDGMDESDFEDFSSFLAKPLAASANVIADTSLSITYNPGSGWWYANFVLTQVYPEFGLSSSIAIKDSVRYEMLDGTPQMVPDETTTHRVLQKASLVVGIGFGGSGSAVQFDVAAGSDVDATGLNTSTVNVSGDGTYAIGITASGNEGTVNMDIGMGSSWNDVAISDPMSSDPCPTEGDISGDFTLDLDVVNNTGHYTANGAWNLGIDFTGGGNTTVNVQSGDFNQSFTGNVCNSK